MTTDIKDLDVSKNYVFDPDIKDWVEQPSIDPMKERNYTLKEAAKEVSLTPEAIRIAIKKGHLSAMQISDSSRVGYHYLIKESDLISWLDDSKAHRRGNPEGWKHSHKNGKTAKAKKEKPVMDISKISEAIQKLIDDEVAKVKEHYETKLKDSYEKGYSDGKEQATLDREDRYQEGYRDGVAEGRKKAAEELSVIARGMYK